MVKIATKNKPKIESIKKESMPVGTPPKYTREWLDKEADILLKWIKDDKDDTDEKMYIGSFAKSRGYHRQRFAQFCQTSEKFQAAYQYALMWQEEKFVRMGLRRKWDPTFTQYVMARVCSPEWRKSHDSPQEAPSQPIQVTINKIISGKTDEKEVFDTINANPKQSEKHDAREKTIPKQDKNGH